MSILMILFIIVAVLLLGFLVFNLMQPSSYHVERSTSIDVAPEKVFEAVSDFSDWRAWSPWLIMEPTATVDVAADKKSYSWSGELVGSGEMAITHSEPSTHIDNKLQFIKPFKSKSDVAFDFEPDGDGTKVTWHMRGKMPLPFRFMTKMMEPWIGSDYERGLRMLKEHLETGAVLSSLAVSESGSVPPTRYAGIRDSCTLDDIGDSMTKAFNQLADDVPEEARIGRFFSIYEEFDIIKKDCRYIAAVAVKDDFHYENGVNGTYPGGKTLQVTHTGSYDHLGNAWAMGYMYSRNKKVRLDKKKHAVELYINDPQETEPKDLITEVHLPRK